MAAKTSLSKSGICKAYDLTEATLAHLEELDLFNPMNGKVVRGERRYIISPALKDVFELGRAHYSSIRTNKIRMFPFQRAIVFYLLSGGPETAYDILRSRGFIAGTRPALKTLTTYYNALVNRAPKSIKKWVKGEQEEPSDSNAKTVELYLEILGITDFWNEPDLVEMPFIYDDIRVRTTVESLLCTHAKYDEIADVVASYHDMSIQAIDIEIYHKFYFDRELVPPGDWDLWCRSLGQTHQKRIRESVDISLSEYARKNRIGRRLSTADEIDAMLAVSQQGFWKHKEAASYGSLDAIKKQKILLDNSVKLFEARLSLVPTDVSSVNDRLAMEFEEPVDLKIVNREDFDQNEIDSPKVAQQAGLRDTSSKEQGA